MTLDKSQAILGKSHTSLRRVKDDYKQVRDGSQLTTNVPQTTRDWLKTRHNQHIFSSGV